MADHNICDACECVAHCSKQGCIPLTEPVIRRAEGGAAERATTPTREPGSGPTLSKKDLNKKDLNKLLNDFARACAFGEDVLARMAASKAIHEYLDAAFAALQGGDAASEAVTDEQIDALDDLVTMVRRLARSLHKAAPNEPLTGLALDYLERKGFNTGPLRSAVNCEWTNCVHRVGDVCCNERAALNSTEKSDGWLPIASAPKDGAMFLCWVSAVRWSAMDGGGSGSEHDVSQIDFCWWRRVPESPDGGYFDNASGQIGDSQGVTHWQPLPTAPKAHGGRDGK